MKRTWLIIAFCVVCAWAVWFFNRPTASKLGGFSNVQYLEPEEYLESTGGMQFLVDEAGKTKFDTLILPKISEEFQTEADPMALEFTGSEACAECHKSYFESYVHTSHFRTSAEAVPSTVLGSFDEGENRLETKSPNLAFEMISRDGQLLQRVLVGSALADDDAGTNGDNHRSNGQDDASAQIPTTFPFDLVFGSVKIGQSYGYWTGDHLYQLHASYLKGPDKWINSPGYIDGTASYGRPIIGRCLECHTTYFENIGDTRNQYNRKNYVLGIGCEKCHGPGRKHVEYHREFPDADASEIVNPGYLSAELSIDTCELCHGGTPLEIKSRAFTYQPGTNLSDHYVFDERNQSPSGIHSNSQFPRLRLSKCFQQTEGMTCLNCHDPHQYERNDKVLFSSRCMKCHEPEHCGKFEIVGEKIRENCIDCHMPRKDITDIQEESGGEAGPKMRDNFIKVWNLESEKYLNEVGIKPK